MAEKLLEQIQPKWHPDTQPPIDGLTHTVSRKQGNTAARKENKQVLFDPALTSSDDLSHNFRIFTNTSSRCIDPAYRKHQPINLPEEEIKVYISGINLGNIIEEDRSGSGIWYGPDNPRNLSLRIPGESHSSLAAKLIAILQVLKRTAPFAPLHINSDSKYIIDGLTKNLPTWEQRGWIGIDNRDLFKAVISHLRQRGAITTFKRSKEPGIVAAKDLAKAGITKMSPDTIDISLNKNFDLTGAQLSYMSQALAYQGIREQEKQSHRLHTVINLDITRYAVESLSGKVPTDADIWLSIRNNDITRSIRVFLWKVLHKTQKCGNYWANIPGFEHRVNCPTCGEEESMTHILTECSIPGQKEIWRLARSLWLAKHPVWPKIRNFGMITGCGLTDFKNEKRECKEGANRLYRILISESAHLIWRLRCERTITLGDNVEDWPSKQEIHNKWVHTINRRLALDQAMTSNCYETIALKKDLVTQTWCGTLRNEESLPDNWIKRPGVLVGIVPLEQPWRQDSPVDPP